ncbi:hypothetical protein G9Q86_00685 [Pseudomonas sp. CCUG 57209]|uniref:hypothetical protein n=1 Tax=Pseudomonas sivasensis TaxID=1880678 RepID=UPI0015ECCD2E|nr:hypothetical protein [Pseudomonas sivasensis]MBA2927069.1 hypothetical protein [Pseudomonas sivasensis]
MSIIEELNEQYERYDAALTLQHNLLTKSLGGLSVGLGSYLGLTKAHWNDKEGKRGDRYVRLGVGAPNVFEEKMWPQLPSTGGVVEFSLAVTLECETATYQRYTFVFEGRLQFSSGGYEYRFQGIDSPIVISAAEVEADDFTSVYRALVDKLKKAFDPASIVIVRG